jgi:hypothetical protein
MAKRSRGVAPSTKPSPLKTPLGVPAICFCVTLIPTSTISKQYQNNIKTIRIRIRIKDRVFGHETKKRKKKKVNLSDHQDFASHHQDLLQESTASPLIIVIIVVIIRRLAFYKRH